MPGFNEKCGLKEGLDILVKRKDGSIKDERHYGDIKDGIKRRRKDPWYIILWKKLVTKQCIMVDGIPTTGKAEVAALILSDIASDAFDYLAIGTGTTAFAAGNTTLETETHRVAGTGTRVTTSVTNDTAQLVVTFSGFSGTEAVTEVGMLNAASTGDLLMRQTFSALNVDWDAGDSIVMTVKIQVT